MAASKKNSASNVDHVEAAIYHLKAIIDPTLASLKETPARVGADTGQEPRREGSFRFILQGVCNTIKHNLTGNMQSGFSNAEGMLTRSIGEYQSLAQKYDADETMMVLDPAFDRIAAWLKHNGNRVTSLNQLYVVFATLFEHVAGKPVVVQPIAVKPSTAIASALTDAAKKAKLAKLAELKEVAAA